jgi:hypothetical protein
MDFLREFWNSLQPATIPQWIAAFATSAAVLIALFKEELIRLLRHPSLSVAPIQPPHCHKLPLRYWIQRTAPTHVVTESYYFRLWIENKGKSKADQVQVFASKLFRRAADGTFKEDAHFLPMNLPWSHYPEESPVVYAEGISPDMGKHCDLGSIVRPTERVELGHDLPGVAPGDTVFALSLEVKPFSQSHLLGPDTYRLELRIAAANSVPVTKILKITHTGNWFDDPDEMFRRGIGLKFVT